MSIIKESVDSAINELKDLTNWYSLDDLTRQELIDSMVQIAEILVETNPNCTVVDIAKMITKIYLMMIQTNLPIFPPSSLGNTSNLN